MPVSHETWSGAGGDNAWATAGNWSAAPESGDSVSFPALAAAATKDVAGSDQSAILLTAAYVEEGNFLNYGSRATPLKMDVDLLDFRGRGARSFFDIVNCAELRILSGVAATSGYSYGMHLVSTACTLLTVDLARTAGSGGNSSLGIAALGGEAAAFTTMQFASGIVTVGTAVVCTTCDVTGGAVSYGSDVTTMTVSGGTVRIFDNNPTTLNLQGGTTYYNSVDIPTKINVYAGARLVLTEDLRAKALIIDLYGGTIVCAYGQLATSTVVVKGGGTIQIA